MTKLEGLTARCAERVSEPGGWHRHQCSRNAVRDGWCKQHHPDAKAARRKATEDRWDREAQAEKDKYLERQRSTVRRFLNDAVAKHPGHPSVSWLCLFADRWTP